MLPFTDGKDNATAVEAVLRGEEVVLRYPALLDARINLISGFLFRLLSRLDLAFLTELLLVLLKELTSNSSKANAKRIFLEEHSLSVSTKEEYTAAIERFSEEVLSEWDAFLSAHGKSKYHIDVRIQKRPAGLSIAVETNTEVLPWEWERIQLRIQSFEKYESIDKAFSIIRDSSEGAGLGIVMTLLLLRNAGISADRFHLKSEGGRTSSGIVIPPVLTPPEVAEPIKAEILKECDAIPSFPDHIAQLIELCNSDTVSIQLIADRIQRDPGLTAQILRLVNSAGYMSRNRNPSLQDAVKIIGLKVIRNLLMVSGARSVINSRYRFRELEQIWEGANRVSFFARRLGKRKDATTAESAAIAGLLFELGKIILFSLKPEFEERIGELQAAGRVRSSAVLEEIGLGIGHPEIGYIVTRQWKLPEPLQIAIRYQQNPLGAPEEYEALVRVVYMAIRLQEASIDRASYYTVEPEVLTEFGIENPGQFDEQVKQMARAYELEAGEATP